MTFVEVVVNRPLHRRPPVGGDPLRDAAAHRQTYTYRLPERLCDVVAVGHLVQVPLQASTALGVVVSFTDESPDLPAATLREVTEILDPLPVVTPVQIDLACWIADKYLAPLSQAMRLMLPPGLEERTSVVVSATSTSTAGLGPDEATVLRWLQSHKGQMRLSALMAHVGVEDPEAVVQALAERGLVQARTAFVPPQAAPPRVQYVRLLADDRTIRLAVPRLGCPSKQADLLLALASTTDAPVPLTELCGRVGCTSAPVHALAARGWVEITEARTLVMASPNPTAAHEAIVGLERAPKQAAVLTALRECGGPREWKEFLRQTGISSAVVNELERKNLVRRIVEPALVLLTLPTTQVPDKVTELRGGEKELSVLEALRGTTGRVWVGGLYAQTGADLATLQRLAARGLLSLHADEYDHARPVHTEGSHRLTPQQELVWQAVRQGLTWRDRGESPFVALLHGVTGSGKTEIYLHTIESVLQAGQRAVVLVPEVSLTAQAVRRFEARLPGRIAVLHSQLSLGQRYAVWERVRRGEAEVLVGPRSALLAPISRLGLIVVDEAHDGSYKQDEPIPLPAYHACDVAVELGRLTGAAVLMGSATPDVVTYYHAVQGTYRLLELPHRILAHAPRGLQPPISDLQPPIRLPPVRIVDLRQELRAGNRSIFSRALQQALRQTLEAKEQAILFLNRRGTATFVLCRDCGYVARCPRCDVPCTFHRQSASGGEGWLVCHRCNHRQPAPTTCPSCGGRRIRYFGLGTERVEASLHQLFPEARVLRWDRDTASGEDHERHLQAFEDHRADVLVGTQMIAKGLDLPLVTLVGIISADTALDLPDYRAAERTFQLLTQVAGRAGRGPRGGQAIIQTYHAEHYAIRAASQHDYAGFYQQELAYRRHLGYPPFNRLVALRYYDRDRQRCQAEAERLAQWLAAEIRRLGVRADLIGPAPCFISRAGDRYRWQIVLRLPDPTPLLRGVALPWGWRVDVDPVSLL